MWAIPGGRAAPTVDCPMCAAMTESRHWTREGGWNIVRCARCGLLQTWPRPDPSTSVSLHATASYYESRSMGASASDEWALRASAILATLPRRPSEVLDFGAGQGHLVHSLRGLGLNAEGFEPSSAGRAAARAAYAIDLLEELRPGPEPSFDLITLIHSLEHVHDPVTTLKNLHPLLRSGGALFIEVPNAASIEMWAPRRRRAILDLPQHLFHFTPPTLALLLEHAGYRIETSYLSNPAFLERALAWRARRAAPTSSGQVRTRLEPTGGSTPRGRIPSLRISWRERILPAIRHRLPGWKMQVVATKA